MLALLLLALPVCQEPAVESPWTPIEIFRGAYPFVAGEVNGQAVSLLIDTGAGATIFDKKLALQLGLEGDQPINVLGVGGEQSATVAREVSLKVGNATLHGLRIIVTDLEGSTEGFGRDLNAILGLDVLSRLAVDLDYPNKRVAFYRSDEFEYEGKGDSLPVKRASGGNLLVQGSIDGHPAVWMDVDTGDGGTLTVHAGYASEAKLLEGRRTASTLLGGIGGMLEGRDAMLDSFKLGSRVWRNMPATFDPSEEGLFEEVEGAANLGSEILSRYRVIFDVPRGVMHLELGPDTQSEFMRDRTGLRGLWKGDYLDVIHVSGGSPAEKAGWKVGERIVAVDGQKIGADYWKNVWGWAFQESGTAVELTLDSGVKRTLRLSQYY